MRKTFLEENLMKKRVFSCVFLITSIQLSAMQTHVVHMPKIADEEKKALNDFVEEQNTSLGMHVVEGTVFGGIGPWTASALLGAAAVEGLASLGTPHGDSLPRMAFGAWLGCVLFSIPNIVLTVPSAVVGACGGLANGIYQEIKEACTKEKKLRKIAFHIYNMIHTIKEGRPKLRSELMSGNVEASVIKTVEAKFNDKETFKRYFGETEFSEQDLKNFLGKIEPKYDNWENFFAGISQIMKISELNEEQWQKLEQVLVNFDKDDEFPKLSPEEIKEHLYVGVYYFSRETKGLKWIKALIQ